MSLIQDQSKTYLFVGCYTNGVPNTGIHVYLFNTKTGELDKVDEVRDMVNSSFLTISPNGNNLYACINTQIETHGSIASFKIESKTGKLHFLNQQNAGGRNPVFVSVHNSNRFVVSSNYTDAGIAVYLCEPDGSLNSFSQYKEFVDSSIIVGRQEGAHVHSVNFSEDGRYLFAPDLGSDKIRVFNFISDSKDGLLEEKQAVKVVPGSGPRHFIFHPNNKYAYCIDELSGTVSSFKYAEGNLEVLNRNFSYTKKYAEYGSADIHISPDGRFLYASNRLNDENTLSIFSIDSSTGLLQLVGHQSTYGDHPRSFVIDPTGQFLLVANQNTSNVVVFKRDLDTGLLQKIDQELQLNLPASLKMMQYNN